MVGQWVLLVVVGTSVWVGLDAKRLGARRGALNGGLFDMGPFGWFAASLLLWIVGFPAYMAHRGTYREIFDVRRRAEERRRAAGRPGRY